MATFLDHPLRLLNPSFSSPLLDVLTDLEHLRRLQLNGTTPPMVFMQLKQVFHLLESLASARIEGNHTTLADYVETKFGGPASLQRADQEIDSLREIANIEHAMDEIDAGLEPGSTLSQHFIRGLHAMTVDGLEREGDKTPGAYRNGSVGIAMSEHAPPDAVRIGAYMGELVDFVNRDDQRKYDLMKVALAHHRFAWIHPFGNGNGRVVRLFTYALLIKYGFRMTAEDGRLLNPAAVFCADREKYYAMLSLADKGTDAALETWCTYVLTGVRDELNKVDRLADYRNLTAEILLPAIAHARERQWITEQEESVLKVAVLRKVVRSADLADAMPTSSPAQRTYQIRKLLANGMLQPTHPEARQYTIGFSNSTLLRGVIKALTDQGFIPRAVVA